jgi:glutaminyl-tRNA synthetase
MSSSSEKVIVSSTPASNSSGRETASNFIREIIDADLKAARHAEVVTRFPPEPNGYLHIGHAKSIVLNFGIARDYDGVCNLRFDDTNPETEDVEYAESIKESVRWLGFDWGDNLFHASDYFEQFFQFAVKLIRQGDAYVCSLTEDEIRAYRGTVTEPGRESPYRSRSAEENLDLFERMRAGAFPDGAHVLRTKIDMGSANMKMRDPLLYRIKHAHHYRTGDDWCIYPMYDFAHPLEDAIEKVTHSLCTLEFDNNRELYDWVLEHCLEPDELPTRPRQYEFSRLNLDYTVMSKRKLLMLVREGHVRGWDDPRMPTLAGLRRRGVPAEAIRTFSEKVGVTKTEGRVDLGLFEHVLRDDLNFRAPRVMAVVKPLKVVITNYPEGVVEWLPASYWPHDIPKEGSRDVPFSRELYIEVDDFMEDPPADFFRLAPGREVRLRYGYLITCTDVVRDDDGEIVEIRATYDPETRGGDAPDGRKVRGTIHWVSATEAAPAEFRLYDRLFSHADPEADNGSFVDRLNPSSLAIEHGYVEPSVVSDDPETPYQFERVGYFRQDPIDSSGDALVFNRVVTLRDSWARKSAPTASTESRAPKPERRPEQPSTPRRDPVEALDDDARARFENIAAAMDITRDDAAALALDEHLGAFALDTARVSADHQDLANWLIHEVKRELNDRKVAEIPFDAERFVELVSLVKSGAINSSAGQEVLGVMFESDQAPETIVQERGLRQVSDDSTLQPVVDQVLAEFPDKVSAYRAGKTGLIGFFTGQVMRRTGGSANPQRTKDLLSAALDGE